MVLDLGHRLQGGQILRRYVPPIEV